MNERPFERHYGELRCRRYLFDAVEVADQTPRPEGAPVRPATRPERLTEHLTDGRAERPQ